MKPFIFFFFLFNILFIKSQDYSKKIDHYIFNNHQETWYQVSKKTISKESKKKFKYLDQIQSSDFEELYNKKCPYIIEYRNEYNRLLSKGEFCSDCCVGVYEEFYEFGGIKTSGNYKKNNSNNWENSFPCWIKNGEFLFFSFSKDTLIKLNYKDNILQDYYPRKNNSIKINGVFNYNNIELLNRDSITLSSTDTIEFLSFFNEEDSLGMEIDIEISTFDYNIKYTCKNKNKLNLPIYKILNLPNNATITNLNVFIYVSYKLKENGAIIEDKNITLNITLSNK